MNTVSYIFISDHETQKKNILKCKEVEDFESFPSRELYPVQTPWLHHAPFSIWKTDTLAILSE